MPDRSGHRTATALAWSTLAGGAVLMLAVWWWGTPDGIGPGTGGAFTAAGQLTGLVGGYLLLAEVALMARTPWLEQRVGTDRISSWHRALGEYTVILLLTHAVLLIVGSTLSTDTSLLRATSTMVFDLPEVLPATIATGLLICIGALSVRSLRAKVSYETWHGTHLLAYLAVFLGFQHQIEIGSQLSETTPRTIWIGVHVAVGVAALWWRVLAPLVLYLRHEFRVVAVIPEGPRTFSIVIGGTRLDRLRAEPGQFFRWRFLTAGRWWQAHPFSLSAAPHPDGLRITVKVLGDHTADLARLRPGTPVFVEGPYGAITPSRFGGRRLLLIGGGVGITPLRALLDAVGPVPDGHQPHAAVIQRVNSHDELLFPQEFAVLARDRRVELHPLVGPPQRIRLDGARLRALVPDIADRDVVICGPPAMVSSTVAGLREAGVPNRRVHIEQFSF